MSRLESPTDNLSRSRSVETCSSTAGSATARRTDRHNIFFSGSEESRAKGMEYLERTQRRQVDRDAPTDLATRDTAWQGSSSPPSWPSGTTTR
jgi:hypothetical protein